MLMDNGSYRMLRNEKVTLVSKLLKKSHLGHAAHHQTGHRRVDQGFTALAQALILFSESYEPGCDWPGGQQNSARLG